MSGHRSDVSERPRVSALVLAGGRAQRFGGDKLAALLRDGRPILAHAVDAVGAVSDEVVIVLAPDGDEPRDLPPGTRFVRDPERYGGPLVGLRAGLDSVTTTRVLIAGGDMPSLVPGVLRRLVAALDEDEAIDGAVLDPGTGAAADRLQTLPSAVRADAARTAAGAALEAGDRRLRGLFERLRLTRVPSAVWRSIDPAGATLIDVDRPGDLPAEQR